MFKPLYTYSESVNLETVYFLDLLSSKIIGLFAESNLYLSYGRFCLFLSFILLGLLFKKRFSVSIRIAAISSALFCLSLFIVAHNYEPLIVMYPLILILLIREWDQRSVASYKWYSLFLVILESYGYLLANNLAIAWFLISRIVYPPDLKSKMELVKTSIFLVYSFAIFYLFSEQMLVFDYPYDARLSDVSSFQRMGEVIFGMERLPFAVNPPGFLHERTRVVFLGSILLLPFAVFFIRKYFLGQVEKYRLVGGLGSALIILLVSWYSSELFSQDQYFNSPEGVAFAVIPGLIWHFSPWFGFIIILLFSYLFFLEFAEFRARYIYLLAFFTFFNFILSKAIFPKNTGQGNTENADNLYRQLEMTPSRFLMNEYELTQSGLIKDSSTLVAVDNLGRDCKLSASRSSEEVNNILDGSIHTKWGTNGFQLVGDWIAIECSKNINFRRISILAGSRVSDFPRGFKIEVGEDLNNLSNIRNFPQWLGKVKLTARGYPYFAGQDQVVVDFNESKSTKAIKITLLKGDPVFDWSIAELELFN